MSLMPLSAMTLPITVKGSTSNSVVIEYTAPDSNACTVTTSPTFNDTNTTLFTNATNDLYRIQTGIGGYKSGVANGLTRIIQLGIPHVSAVSSSTNISYSLAEGPPASSVSITVSCDSGAVTGSVSAVYATLQLGNTAPYPVSTNTANWGNWPYPFVDQTAQADGVSYLDQDTGVFLKPITQPGMTGAQLNTEKIVETYQTGTAWTGALSSFSSTTNTGNYASTTATGQANAIFLIPTLATYRGIFDVSNQNEIDDVAVWMHASETNGGTASICLSVDFGHSCVAPAKTVTPSSTASWISFPSGSYPNPYWKNWGSNFPVRYDQLANVWGGSYAVINGNTVIWGSGANQDDIFFPITALVPGVSTISVPGSAAYGCPQNHCTVASIVSERQLTLAQTLPSATASVSTTLSAAVAPAATSFTVASATGFTTQVKGISAPSGNAYVVVLDGNDYAICFSLSGNTFSQCMNIQNSHSSGASAVEMSTNSVLNVATLSAATSVGATSITVNSTSGFVVRGWSGYASITIGSDSVYCSTISGTTLSGCTGLIQRMLLGQQSPKIFGLHSTWVFCSGTIQPDRRFQLMVQTRTSTSATRIRQVNKVLQERLSSVRPSR